MRNVSEEMGLQTSERGIAMASMVVTKVVW